MNPRLRKLMGMSPREIIFRLRHHAAIASERTRFLSGAFEWSEAEWSTRLCATQTPPPLPDDLAQWWEKHLRQRKETPMFLSSASLPRTTALYRDLFPEQVQEIEARAEASCKGYFSFKEKPKL